MAKLGGDSGLFAALAPVIRDGAVVAGRCDRAVMLAATLVAVQNLAMDVATIELWRPVGPQELALIRASGMTVFPPRLPEQPFFYPVLSRDYATRIARDWNVTASGSGHVTRFRVLRSFLDAHAVQTVGGRDHQEYWIPAEELPAFNAAIVGAIEVTDVYP